MTVGEKIREARLKKGYTQTELAELLGYKSRSSINKIEVEGRDIPRSSIIKFAEVLGVTPAYLMGWEDEPKIESNATVLPRENIRMIPVYESVSAGFGAYADNYILDYMPCYILSDDEAGNTMCIKVTGDSMFPKIESGDIIQVRKQSSVDSGQIAVVLLDGEEGLVKKVIYGEDWIELHSINPMYPVRRFDGADVERIRVVGIVKKIIKDV